MKLGKYVRWILVGIAALFVLALAVIFLFPGTLAGPTAPPLELPPLNAAQTGARPASLDGIWTIGSNSVAGFRVEESFLTQHSTIVGRTSAVTGSVTISGSAVSAASFQVDLSQLTLGGKQNASFVKLLDTKNNPNATFTLTDPIRLPQIPADGQTVSSSAVGSLTMHGVTHSVTLSFTGRVDGSTLEVTGTVPVLASDWAIDSPFGIHDDAVIEFLILLQKG